LFGVSPSSNGWSNVTIAYGSCTSKDNEPLSSLGYGRHRAPCPPCDGPVVPARRGAPSTDQAATKSRNHAGRAGSGSRAGATPGHRSRPPHPRGRRDESADRGQERRGPSRTGRMEGTAGRPTDSATGRLSPGGRPVRLGVWLRILPAVVLRDGDGMRSHSRSQSGRRAARHRYRVLRCGMWPPFEPHGQFDPQKVFSHLHVDMIAKTLREGPSDAPGA
jgi:hypothetical protein